MSNSNKRSAWTGRLLQKFGGDKRGTVAIIFGFAILPVLAFMGAAIDYSRALHVQTQLQVAADAAAIAGAVSKDVTVSGRELAAQNSFDGNTENVSHNATVTRSVTPGAGQITVTATASVPMSFMQLMSYDTFELEASSTVHYGGKKLELALVLDTTGSMNGVSSGTKTKLDELKDAVPTILDIVMPAGSTDSRVALVPFATYVNVGSTDTAKRTGRVYPYNTKRCVLERKNGSRPNEDPPTNGVDEFWIKTSNSSCSSIKPITPLTSNRATLDTAMQNLTASGSTSGHLGIQWGWHMISPLWSSVWPAASVPVGYTDETTIKAIVVLTDGNFTEFHRKENKNSAYCNGSSDCPESRLEAKSYCDAIKQKFNSEGKESVLIFTIGFGLDPDYGPSSNGGLARNTMKHCASYVDKNLRDGQNHGEGQGKEKHFYFPVTEADLQAAFSSIGNALTEAVNRPRLTN